MVYFCLVITYPNPVDETKDCVIARGSGNSDEIKSLTGWRYWIENDANSFIAIQPYGPTLGN